MYPDRVRRIGFIVAALAGLIAAEAAPAQDLREADDLVLLRQPGYLFDARLMVNDVPNPADPISIALRLGAVSTVRIVETPPPELATLAIKAGAAFDQTHADRLRAWLTRRFVAVGEMGVTHERINAAADRGIFIEPTDEAGIRLVREALGAAALLGRVPEVARHVDAVWIPADRVILGLERVGGAAFTSHHIALGVVFEPRSPSFLPQRAGMHERRLLYNAVHELGHLFWFSLTDDQRSEFTERFWPDGQRPDESDTVSAYATTNVVEDFAECFVIACFYPTTFETAPVLGKQVLPPGPSTRLQGPALERVRFVDRHINAALAPADTTPRPLNRLRENRFTRMLQSPEPKDTTSDD